MKRIVQTAILSMFCLIGFAQTGDIMIIERNDGTRQELNVDDIRRVFFETVVNQKFGKPADAIDLGLSVKWASWDIGATKVGEKGGYYGWADPTGEKTSTNDDDYPNANPPECISGTEYDIARVQWGNQWRMPTYYEVVEMVSSCEWTYGSDRVTVKADNGQSLVFMLDGYRYGKNYYKEGVEGRYWAGGSFESNETRWCYTIWMPKDSSKVYSNYGYRRNLGHHVRPVQGDDVNVITRRAASYSSGTTYIYGTVAAAIGLTSYTRGFFLSTNGTPSANNYVKKITDEEKNTDGYFSTSISSGLSPSTTYYVRAYVYSSGKYYYGKTLSFTTAAPQASFEFSDCTHSIASTTVTLSGNVTATGTSGSYQCGFLINSSSTVNESSYNTKWSTSLSGNTTQQFSKDFTLEAGKTYYYRPFVYYNSKYNYGTVQSFTVPAETKLFEEPYTTWSATTATVKNYMKGYTIHEESVKNGLTYLQYEGKYKENFVLYIFDEDTRLISAEVAIQTSKTSISDLHNLLQKNYSYVSEDDGTRTYLSQDKATAVFLSENTSRGIFYIDYVSTEYLKSLNSTYYEEPYVNWGAARSTVKSEMSSRGYTLYQESTQASDNYYLVYEGKKKEVMSMYYFNSSQKLIQTNVVFSGSIVDELREYVTSELSYTFAGTNSDGNRYYYLTPDKLSNAIIYTSTLSNGTVVTTVVYISSSSKARKSESATSGDTPQQATIPNGEDETAGNVKATPAPSPFDRFDDMLSSRLVEQFKQWKDSRE